MEHAFFVPDGADGQFLGTVLTTGPWDARHMHAGPPAALVGRVLESAGGIEDALLARVTFEILRPLPVGPVQVTAAVERPGRNVELVTASLVAEGKEIMRALGWRIRRTYPELSAGGDEPPPPGPETGRHEPFFAGAPEVGYHSGMEWRFVEGSFVEPGPATVWMRPAVPIVAGEDITALDRVLVMADSGNGVSAALPPAEALFVNTDLTVHLHRPPVGEWVCMAAHSTLDPQGIGLAATALYDEQGPIGRGAQALFVARR